MSLKNLLSVLTLLTFVLVLPHCKKNDGFTPMPCGIENGACDDSNPCTKDTCDELTNECTFVPMETFECLPRIIIDEPARAIDIQEDGDVQVKGRVTSGYGPVQDFKINGTYIDFEDDGAFTFTVSPDFGMNLLIAEAKDQTGATTKAVQSFFYSSQWNPRDPHDADVSSLPEAIFAWLGRHAIDDGDHDLNNVNDLATVCEIIVASTDLQGLSNPDEPVNTFAIPGLGSFDVYVTAIRLGPPSVTLSPQNGGLHLRLSYAWMEADLEFRQPGPTVGSETVYPAMATASPVVIDADMGISTAEEGGILVEATNANVTMENFNIAFDLENDTLEAAINAVLNIQLIKQIFIDQIEQSFEEQLSGTLEELVAGFLGSTAFEIDGEFPPILGSEQPTPISLKATPKSAEFTSLGGTIGLEASALSDRTVYYPTLGSISRAGCLLASTASLWFDPTYTIQFAIQDDFANQMLFAVWWGGGFQFPIGSTEEAIAQLSRIGITDLDINVDVLHPPILTSCNSENAIRMQMGDMKIRVTLEIAESEYVNLDVYTSLEADMEYRVLETEDAPVISLNFVEMRQLETEVVLDDPSLAKHLETLREFIENFFIDSLIENLTTGDVAGFPLPTIDLSVVEGVPPGYELTIGVDNVLHMGDYTLVQGHPE